MGCRLLRDALLLEEAGCFAIVLEAIPTEVATAVSRRLEIPTIGIGAGPATDGQVLVLNDPFGLLDAFKPRFVKRYAALRAEMTRGVAAFAADVRERRFPAKSTATRWLQRSASAFWLEIERDG